MTTTDLRLALLLCATVLAAGCSTLPQQSPQVVAPQVVDSIRMLDRVTWGANVSSAREAGRQTIDRYLAAQLKADNRPDLPETVAAQIAAMTISQKSLPELVQPLDQQRRDSDAIKDDGERKAAKDVYLKDYTKLAREAQTRTLLRALYSSNQLREKMTWFWFNHFNVYQFKASVRAMIGDYEEHAIRPHALGRFRDLLGAVTRHPAMLVYLDNAQNAAGRINENLARELMELHTLGVEGGYSQRDVQELARILTGVGVNLTPGTPRVRAAVRAHYVRDGLFEFNPNRHDFGDKEFLGQPVRGEGLKELDEALDHLARHPATARFVSRKLATYFVADNPPQALVERLAAEFQRSDGDIAATLSTLFASAEFTASLGTKFKDPMHYVLSAVRLAYDDKPIVNALPILGWLNRMGEPLYGRQTPDGYPLTSAAWASPGQMATRFEIARAIGSGNAGLFRGEGSPAAADRAALPQLSNELFHASLQPKLSEPTKAALEQAGSPREWNVFLLASPEFMNR